MPTDIENLVVYVIVVLTGLWLTRRSLIARRKRANHACGGSCCDLEVNRAPVIQKFLDRQNRRS